MKRNELEAIGIFDDSFEFHTVSALVKAGILERPIDGNHGEIHPKGEDFVSTGVPFLMASDIDHGVVDYQSCKFITAKQADGLRKGFARNGDVLLTHKATIGRTAIVDYHAHPYVMLTPQVTYYRVRDKKRLSNRYLRLYFESSFFQSVLSLWAGSGATRAYLGITEQGKLPIVLPPFGKQQKLAAVLSAYDDLIENNRRRIALLERMAEQLYREWFVRFRFPCHRHVKFVKGVPSGWSSLRISDVMRFEKGKNPDAVFNERREDSAPYITIDAIEGGNPVFTILNRKSVLCESSEILMVMDGARSGMVARGVAGVVGSTLSVLRIKSALRNVLFEYMKAGNEVIVFNNTGSAVPHASKDFINKMIIRLPKDDNLIARFNEQYDAIRLQTERLVAANVNLTKTRNLLLPRLISGKLRVDQLDIQFPPSMQTECA